LQIHDAIKELLDALFQRAGDLLAEVDTFPPFGAVLFKDGRLEPVVAEHGSSNELDRITSIQVAIEAIASRTDVQGYGICLCDRRDELDVAVNSSQLVIVMETSEQALRVVIPYEREASSKIVFNEAQYTMDRVGILSDS